MASALTLDQMRLRATGLLLVMAAVYVTAKIFEDVHPAVPFIRAFSEAAMVGGLADWFAVTALFRRPLGLPIPHTAIIPRSKDRIGEGLARFLKENFLKPELVAERLEKTDLAGAAARWLAEPDRATGIARALADAAPRIIDLLNDERVSHWARDAVSDRIRAVDAPSLLADILDVLTANGRHQGVVDLAITHADRLLEQEEPELRRKVTERTGWFSRLFDVDQKAADALVGALRETIREAALNPDHPLRRRVDEAVAEVIVALRYNRDARAEVTRWVHGALDQPVIQRYFGGLWAALKAWMKADAPKIRDEIAARLAEGFEDLVAGVLEDAELRATVNTQRRAGAQELAAARGPDVAALVADTIRAWDAHTVVEQIEAGVGKDLQYIRISGTLVGGLVGLVLHTLSVLLFD
jgi:uncharacterized membrane-anchored protein YjiN (DUF445 family)